MKGLGIKEVTELNVMQIEPLKEVEKLINTLPVSKHISYLQYNLLDAAAPYLSDDFVTARFDFYGKVLSGRQQNSPRWKRAVSAVESMLGEAVGQMYVEKYFLQQPKNVWLSWLRIYRMLLENVLRLRNG